MPRQPRHFQLAFNAGEWSPLLHSRFDLEKYQHACKTLENFLPFVYGGVSRRPGTRFIAEAKRPDDPTTLSTKTPTANEVGTTGWTNPNNAHAEDAVYATATVAAGPNISTLWKTFGFTIPTGANITSVLVRCRYKVSAQTSVANLAVRPVIAGTAQTTRRDWSEPLADSTVTFNFTDVRAWSSADFSDANFKVEVTAAVLTGGSITFSLDSVAVDVTYSTPSTAAAKAARLIPFEFNILQAYIIEAGDQYMRFYANNGRVESDTTNQKILESLFADNINPATGATLISNGTFDTSITGWTDLSTGGGIFLWDGVGAALLARESAGTAAMETSFATTSGNQYVVRLDVDGSFGTTGNIKVQIGTTSGASDVLSSTNLLISTTGVTTLEILFKAASATTYLKIFEDETNHIVTVDNVTAKDAASPGWTSISTAGGGVAWSSITGYVKLYFGAGTGVMEHSLTTVNKTKYTVKFDILEQPVKVRVGSTSGGQQLFTEANFNAGTAQSLTFVATSTSSFLQFKRDAANPGGVDNITVVSDLIVNGTFDADITSWTNKSTGTGSIAFNGVAFAMDVAGGASGVGVAEQSFSPPSSSGHTLSFDVATNPITVRIGTTSGGTDIIPDTIYAAGTGQTVNFTPGENVTLFLQFRNPNNNTSTMDNVSIKPVVPSPVEVSTPYGEGDLSALQFAQSADVIYFAHPKYAPRKLSRISSTSFTFALVPFVDGPYLDENTDTAKTLTPSATTGTITLTATGHSPFQQGHIGSLWRLTHGSTTGYVEVTAFTSTTVVTATVKKTLGAITATEKWREGAWSTVRGFPGAVTFFEDRIIYARTDHKPQTFWGSGIGTYEDFTPGTADDDAYTFSVTSGSVNVIQWLVGTRVLLIGTAGEEYSAQGASGKTITPTSIEVKLQTTHGSAAKTSVRIDNSVLFIQRTQKTIREMAFDFDVDGYVSSDTLLLADHLTKDATITEIAYQEEPSPILWAIRSDGVLLALTYEKTEQVAGWARHTTDGKFASVAVIPHPNGDRDQVWLIAERTINGVSRRYIEYLDDVGSHFGSYKKFGVDSGLTYSGAATATLSGLGHLEGKTVAILGDGAVYPSQAVTAGQVTGLSPTVTAAEVGLAFTSTLEPLPPAPPAALGLERHRAKVLVRLHESLGLTVAGKVVPFRKSGDLMGQPPPIFTGDVDSIVLGWEKDQTVKIEQTQALPCTVIAVHGVLDTAD